uniref:Uncharacterized protein n=1 Tax=Cucumis melo TaxID=3656 RepID=A0A9I9E567_CUCME
RGRQKPKRISIRSTISSDLPRTKVKAAGRKEDKRESQIKSRERIPL